MPLAPCGQLNFVELFIFYTVFCGMDCIAVPAEICLPCNNTSVQGELADRKHKHVENDSSIGLRSGEYGGRNNSIITEDELEMLDRFHK